MGTQSAVRTPSATPFKSDVIPSDLNFFFSKFL